jgi:hypothetical protein
MKEILAELFNVNLSAIKGIAPLPFWFIIGLLCLFLFYYFIKWYKSITHSRVMEDTPTAKIRSAAQGYVELQGKQNFLDNRPIVAPLSKLPCTWYRFSIERLQRNRWVLIEQGSSINPFQLEDETGVCVIDPVNAQVNSQLVDVWTGFNRYPNGKPSNIFMKIISLFGRYRYREWRMEAGMPLYAIGNFRTISKEDWVEIEKTTHNKLLKQLSGNEVVNILTSANLPAGKPFLLSTRDQHKIISSFKMDSIIWLVAYVTLFIGISCLIIVRMS